MNGFAKGAYVIISGLILTQKIIVVNASSESFSGIATKPTVDRSVNSQIVISKKEAPVFAGASK